MTRPDGYGILNGLNDGVLIIDQEYTIVFANKHILDLYGIDREDIVGMKCFNILHHCLVPCRHQCVADDQCGHYQVFTTGRPITVNHQHLLPDGSEKTFQISISPLLTETGTVDLIIHLTKDITEQEQLRRKYLTTLAEQETIFNNSPYTISYLDPEMRVRRINAPMEELVGRNNAEVQGKYCYEIWGQHAGDTTRKGREKICDVCRIRDTFVDGGVWTYERKIGERDIEVTSSTVRDQDGVIIGTLEVGKDITEQKKAQKLLHVFERIISTTQDLMAFIDENYIYQAVNDAYCKAHKRKQADIIGTSVADLMNQEVFERVIKGRLDRALAGETIQFDAWFEYPGAGRRYMDVTYNPFTDMDKNGRGVVVSCRDITERREAEEALEANEYRFRQLFTNMSTGVVIYEAVEEGTDFIIRDINPAGLKSSQAEKSTILNRKIRDVLPGVVEMGLFQVFLDVYRTGKSASLPAALYRDEERTLWLESFVCKLPSGEIVGFCNDITERKRSEQELIKSKQEWERTFDSFTDVVTLQDPSMRVVKVNRAGCETLGLDCGEIINKYCYELFHGGDEPCTGCPLLETRKDFQAYTREMFHQKLNKTFLVSAAPVLDADGELEYIAHVAKDITELKQLQQKLTQAQKMEAIGTLAGGIAHDFNNILSAIIGYSELIEREIPADSMAAKDIVEVLESGKRGADLVKQILTFSRKTDLEKAPLHAHLIVKEALKMLRATLPTTILIEEHIDPDCGMILANSTNIHQVVINLCTNALHAMADAKGKLTVSLQRRQLSAEELTGETSLSPGAFVVLTVSDTGSGMDQATMARIFEPYFTTKTEGRGTGLGLAVIHGIVKDAQGSIKVKSTMGEGSTFAVYFPILQKETSGAETSNQQIHLQGGGNEHILVVDDEPLLVRVIKRQLEDLGYRVTATTNSIDALEKIRTAPEQFDLLITDQTMPGLTGTELALAVMEIKPDFPIIMCTGHSDQISREKALELGIKKFVFKPVVSDELSRSVRSVLDENLIMPD